MSLSRTEPRWLPAGTFGRLVLLFGTTLVATLLIAAWTLRTISIEPGGEQMADLLAGQLFAARALARQSAGEPLARGEGEPVLDIGYAAAAPASAHAPWLPFLRRLSNRLEQRLGPGSDVLIEDGPPSRLWVRAAGDPQWIGIAVPHFATQAALLSLITALSGLVLVLLAAGLFARSLTRPLVRLARAAPQLAQGESPDPRIGHEGPREVRELATALLTAAADVRAVARDRELMLAGLSHDLRTPLARLRLALELLGGEAALREEMNTDLAELDAIVGQFVDYARDGREEGRQPVDLAVLAQEVGAQHAATDAWRYTGPPRLLIDGRPLALRRALANLVRNARRHGAPPLELELQATDEHARLTVRDHGPGVADEQLAALGRPFFRASNASGAGSGLGLAVAARVAGLHGGRLAMRNLDPGFEATLELPARPMDERPRARPSG